MRNILYILAVVLLVGWIFGYFVMGATKLVHILLVLAVIAFLLQLIRGRD